jgi:hypothetical protein
LAKTQLAPEPIGKILKDSLLREISFKPMKMKGNRLVGESLPWLPNREAVYEREADNDGHPVIPAPSPQQSWRPGE